MKFRTHTISVTKEQGKLLVDIFSFFKNYESPINKIKMNSYINFY